MTEESGRQVSRMSGEFAIEKMVVICSKQGTQEKESGDNTCEIIRHLKKEKKSNGKISSQQTTILLHSTRLTIRWAPQRGPLRWGSASGAGEPPTPRGPTVGPCFAPTPATVRPNIQAQASIE